MDAPLQSQVGGECCPAQQVGTQGESPSNLPRGEALTCRLVVFLDYGLSCLHGLHLRFFRRLLFFFTDNDVVVLFLFLYFRSILNLFITGEAGGDRDFYRHHHIVLAVGSMVPGDETFLFDSAAHDKFRLHPVGTDGGHPQVFLFVVKGIAVAVHVERKTAAEYDVLVPAHTFQQPGKLPFVAVKRHIEHILLWYETEGVGGVRFFLRKDRDKYCRQPQKRDEK